jgi:transposase
MAGWWQLLVQLGAVPRVLVWDGESAVGRWRGGRSELTEHAHAFRGVLGAKVLICRPRDPAAKGLVERLHDYIERSFLPGRSFTGPVDFNDRSRPGSRRSTPGRGGRSGAPRSTGWLRT